MSEELGVNGNRVRIELEPAQAPEELVVWSFYTGRRARTDYDDLGAAIQSWLSTAWAGDLGSGMAEVSRAAYYIDEWKTPILSGDGWGTAWSAEDTGFGAAGSNLLPLQLSVVVSRRTFDEELPQRRSYNRAYMGPMGVGSLASNGRVIETFASTMLNAWKSLDVTLSGIALEGGVSPAFAGLCNVSYRGKPTATLGTAQIAATNRLFVGTLFDTQRSRRNALEELYVVDDFNPVPSGVSGLRAGLK